MKKKIVLCAMLSSVALSIYPAKVLIRNQTYKAVFARINDQKRSFRFWEDQDFWNRKMFFQGTPADVFYPVFEGAFAARRAVGGYPNFVKIGPRQSHVLGTALRRIREEEGGPLGSPITKITFARVTGHKTITGTIAELQAQVNDLANRYGDITLKDNPTTIELNDELSGIKKSWEKKFEQPENREQYSIEIPVLEQFTYILGKDRIGMNERRIVRLQSWGNAVLTGRF